MNIKHVKSYHSVSNKPALSFWNKPALSSPPHSSNKLFTKRDHCGISLYLVQMREKMEQKKLRMGHFSRSGHPFKLGERNRKTTFFLKVSKK